MDLQKKTLIKELKLMNRNINQSYALGRMDVWKVKFIVDEPAYNINTAAVIII